MLADYECTECGKIEELLSWEKHECCGKPMRRVFSLSRYSKSPKGYSFDFREGYDWGAGQYFHTRAQRDTWEREHNVTVKDKGYYGPARPEKERR